MSDTSGDPQPQGTGAPLLSFPPESAAPQPVRAAGGDTQDLLATQRADTQDLLATQRADPVAAAQAARAGAETLVAPGTPAAARTTAAATASRAADTGAPLLSIMPGADTQDQLATQRATQPASTSASTAATVPASPALAETVAATQLVTPAAGSSASAMAETQVGDASGRAHGQGSGSYVPATSAGTVGGRTGTMTRALRTRTNASLPPDTQALDQRLQMSRPSVLADLVSTRQARQEPLSAGITQLVATKGTEARYVIERPLAEGGMGAVLHIEDHDFHRPAAMKVIKGRFAANPDAVERFLAEAQVTAQLEHPNIVPVHDLGVMEDGSIYYTMMLIQGMSLGTVVKKLQQHQGMFREREKPVPPDAESEAVTRTWTEEHKLMTFLKVLDGVGYANAKGVIHRDLKPDNVMLGAHGEVLVVDWGIAKVQHRADRESELVRKVASVRDQQAASETMSGAAMGTPFYMPPEQATGDLDRIAAWSDVYALGATLYELLCLKRCLDPGPMADVLVKVTRGQWIPLNQRAPHLHPDLVAIVHRAMALTPERRYPTCAAFADDLRRYLSGKAVAARQRGLVELVREWARAHRRQILLGTSVAVLVAATGIGTWWTLGQARVNEGNAYLERVRTALTRPDVRNDLAALRERERELANAEARLGAAAVKAQANELAGLIATLSADQERERNARAAREAKLAQAQALFAEARLLREEGERGDEAKLAQAGLKLSEARKANSEDAEIAQADSEVRALLANAAERKAVRAAATAFASARDRLARLATIDPVAHEADFAEQLRALRNDLDQAATRPAQGLNDLIVATAKRDAEAAALRASAKALALANAQVADGEAKLAADPGTARDAAIAALKILPGYAPALALRDQATTALDRAAAAAARQERRALASAAIARVSGLHAAGNFTAAREALGAARDHALSEKDLLDEIAAQTATVAAAEATAQRTARLAASAEDAAKELAKAQAEYSALAAARTAFLAAAKTAARERERLADQPIDRQGPWFAALNDERTRRAEVAERWSNTEAAANRALALLSEQPEHATATAARDLLATVYGLRLATARAERALPEIRAYSNLIARLGPTYAARLTDRGALTVDAPAGLTVRAVRLDEGAEGGRLVPQAGSEATLVPGQATSLAAGAWQVSSGDTRLTVLISSNRPLRLAWPATLPALPGFALRYVPPADQVGAAAGPAKGYLLGETEVTLAQYLPFLNEPAQLAKINASIKRMAELRDAGKALGPGDFPDFLPKAATGEAIGVRGEPFQVFPIPRFGLEDDGNLPVVGVRRDDAEAFCAWLAKRSGLNVRLPTAAERAFAAHGGDDRRVHPWGAIFVGRFAASGFAGHTSVKVGTTPTDAGPFGHVDLAGNVREWLGDRKRPDAPLAAGVHGGLIAGGGFSDDAETVFRSTYTESVEPIAFASVIGFRILVELP